MTQADRKKLRDLLGKLTTAFWRNDGALVCPAYLDGETVYVQSWRPVAEAASTDYARFIAAANPATILALLDEVDAANANHENAVAHMQSVCAERDQLKAENAELRRLHGYWKQRAKSAEGHLFSSDFQAAGRQLHAMTSFHSIPIEKLNITQSAKISYAVMGVLSTVNHQRAARRPKDTPAPIIPTNSRDQFEQHFPWVAAELEWNGIRYVDDSVQLSWVTWLLSRQALVVELPAKISHLPHSQVADGVVLPEAEQYDEAIDDCREAIEAVGVRVRE